MLGRFTSRRPPPPPPPASVAADVAVAPAVEIVAPPIVPAPAPEEPLKPTLLSEKLLDAKVRLHRRLIEEVNLSVLEKMPDEEMRRHIHGLVQQYIVAERLALNAHEL